LLRGPLARKFCEPWKLQRSRQFKRSFPPQPARMRHHRHGCAQLDDGTEDQTGSAGGGGDPGLRRHGATISNPRHIKRSIHVFACYGLYAIGPMQPVPRPARRADVTFVGGRLRYRRVLRPASTCTIRRVGAAAIVNLVTSVSARCRRSIARSVPSHYAAQSSVTPRP